MMPILVRSAVRSDGVLKIIRILSVVSRQTVMYNMYVVGVVIDS